MWQHLLQGGESSQFAWVQALGEEGAVLRRYLTATGRVAEFIPCGDAGGCGWRVAPDGLTGRCPEGVCTPKEFDRSDIAMVDVDWSELLGNLGRALGLDGVPGQIDRLAAATQLGWIAPAEPARFAVFFCAPSAFFPAFPMIQRFAERVAGKPFVLVIASRELLDTDSLGLLASRKAEVVFLDDSVRINQDGRMEAEEAAERLATWALRTAGVVSKISLPKFPTPRGAQWKDFTIAELDGATVEFRAKVRVAGGHDEPRAHYSYERLGLSRIVAGEHKLTADGLFLQRILRHRRAAETTLKKWDSLRGYRSKIGDLLQRITGLPSEDAFIRHDRVQCYEAAFQVECLPGEEAPLPATARRLNRRGEIAKGPRDE